MGGVYSRLLQGASSVAPPAARSQCMVLLRKLYRRWDGFIDWSSNLC